MTTTTTASAQQRYAAALRRQRQQHDEAATARVAKQEAGDLREQADRAKEEGSQLVAWADDVQKRVADLEEENRRLKFGRAS